MHGGIYRSSMCPATEPFDQVLGPLIPAAYRLSVAILGDRELAEDAVQEASVKAWRKLHTLRERSALEPWFMAIVANQCRAVRRQRWWQVIRRADVEVATGPAEDRAVASMDLDRALDRLHSDDRLALYLHFYRDLTYEEVGHVMGISMTAARSRIHRAAKRLRPDLELQESVGNG
jgi:RNA polymerase sigma-70 factor (ECF subfamily)